VARGLRGLAGVVLVLGWSWVAVGSASASGWTIEPTPPMTADAVLSRVSCISHQTCFAIGDSAGAVIEQRLGGTWSIDATPAADSGPVNDVSCVSRSFCMVVGGDTGDNIATSIRWNGSRWSGVRVPGPGSGTNDLTAVSCSSRKFCLAIGDWSNDSNTRGGGLVERWNGSRWLIQQKTNENGLSPDAVACVSRKACILLATQRITGRRTRVMERWTKVTGRWKEKRLVTGHKSRHKSNFAAFDLWCGSIHDCLAPGITVRRHRELTVAAHWNGRTWTLHSMGLAKKVDVSSISCLSSHNCWAAGETAYVPVIEHWNGRHWALQQVPLPPGTIYSTFGQSIGALTGISCAKAIGCTAVGYAVFPSLGDENVDQTLVERLLP
jgi:hypothetical protein